MGAWARGRGKSGGQGRGQAGGSGDVRWVARQARRVGWEGREGRVRRAGLSSYSKPLDLKSPQQDHSGRVSIQGLQNTLASPCCQKYFLGCLSGKHLGPAGKLPGPGVCLLLLNKQLKPNSPTNCGKTPLPHPF
jgi:hypothetical protein